MSKINAEYEKVRNSLIPVAFKWVENEIGERPKKGDDEVAFHAWNNLYLRRMDELMNLRKECPACGCPIEVGVNL